MKTFQEVVSQPTTKTGELKSGLALTKLANDTSLTVETEGTITINGTSVSLAAVTAAALLPAYDNKYDTDLETLIKVYSEGYVIPTQRNIALAGPSEAKKNPIHSHKKLLTAEQYRDNCIKLATVNPLQLYATASNLVANPKVTKDQLLAFVTELAESFMSEEQTGTYQNMVAMEEKLAKQYQGLTDAGFREVKRVNDTLIQAVITAAEAPTAIPELTKLGYVLNNTTFDAVTMQITVFFVEGKVEVLV